MGFKRIFFRNIIMVIVSAVIIGAFIIISMPDSEVEIVDTNTKVGDEKIYLAGNLRCLDCSPTPYVLFEDEEYEVVVLKAGENFTSPLIKRWFSYFSVIEAYEKGWINLRDIEDSDSDLFVYHEKKTVKTIMSAERIEVTYNNISSGFFINSTSEESILTGYSLNVLKGLFENLEFNANEYIARQGEIICELKIYINDVLIETINIDSNGKIFEIQAIFNPWVGSRAVVDSIDVDLLEEILESKR